MRIFVSTEDTHDPLAARLIEQLRAAPNVEVDHSPLNLSRGDDPRWQGWYRFGLQEAVAQADAFVAVQTAGYDASSWMAEEARVGALQQGKEGRPHLFVVRTSAQPLAEGFAVLTRAARALPPDPERAAHELLAQLGLTPA